MSRLARRVALMLGAASLVAGSMAASAQAAPAIAVAVNTSSDGTTTKAQLSITGTEARVGGQPGLNVSGTASGVLTITAPGGLVVLGATGNCSGGSGTVVVCGSAVSPITYLTVSGSSDDDVIDLSGLAEQDSAPKAFPPISGADVGPRARGVFAYVQTFGGADTIYGGGAGAIYEPGPGNDAVWGGDGDEQFRSDATVDGDDTFAGGAGYDTLSYARRTDPVQGIISGTLTGGLGGDSEVDSVDGVETLTGGHGADHLAIGGRLEDRGTLLGGDGDDTLTGGDGDDLLQGGPGADTVSGGGGDDMVFGAGGFGTGSAQPTPDARDSLSGGPGDDELFEAGARYGLYRPTVGDHLASCGPGNDLLHADPDLDEGVGATAWPADCEALATIITGDAPLLGLPVSGQTLTLGDPVSFLGSAPGRTGPTTWSICHPGVSMCESRKTATPHLVLTAADVGSFIVAATQAVVDAPSTAARWGEERPYLGVDDQFIHSGGTETITAPTGPAMPTPAPVVTPRPITKPDAGMLAKAFAAKLGAHPTVTLLGKRRSIAVAAPLGARVSVRLTSKLPGRKAPVVVAIAKGTGTATAVAKLALTPTTAGRALAHRGKAVKLMATVSVTNAAGTATSTLALRLRRG